MWFPLHCNMRPLPARVSREVPRSILKFEMLLGTLDATPKFPNIPVSLQGNTEVPGVSREVPYTVLKCETVLDTLESTQWAPRDPCRDLRGKRSPLLPLQASPDSPGESGMETLDPCLPLRGILGPGHTPR